MVMAGPWTSGHSINLSGALEFNSDFTLNLRPYYILSAHAFQLESCQHAHPHRKACSRPPGPRGSRGEGRRCTASQSLPSPLFGFPRSQACITGRDFSACSFTPEPAKPVPPWGREGRVKAGGGAGGVVQASRARKGGRGLR